MDEAASDNGDRSDAPPSIGCQIAEVKIGLVGADFKQRRNIDALLTSAAHEHLMSLTLLLDLGFDVNNLRSTDSHLDSAFGILGRMNIEAASKCTLTYSQPEPFAVVMHIPFRQQVILSQGKWNRHLPNTGLPCLPLVLVKPPKLSEGQRRQQQANEAAEKQRSDERKKEQRAEQDAEILAEQATIVQQAQKGR